MARMSPSIKVECYAGYKADERPLRFTLQGAHGARTLDVRKVLDQWYGAGYSCFKVLADDGIYILRHHEAEDIWVLDSFRRGSAE